MIGIKIEILTTNRSTSDPYTLQVYQRVPDVGWQHVGDFNYTDAADLAGNLLTDLDVLVPENDLTP